MSSLALDLLIAARVVEIKRDAMPAAGNNLPHDSKKTNGCSEALGNNLPRPHPIMILPPEHARSRRVLMCLIVHRPAH